MKFALAFAASISADHDRARAVCEHAAAAGFESLWGGEHPVMPARIASPYPYSEDGSVPATGETPIPDPLIWLAFAAAVAPTMRLGTCILILPQRNPLLLAKELATLDRLSGGKVELGIGVGWMREEFDALGVPWAARGARTDEYVEVMRALWAGPEVEYHGRFVDFEPVTCSPRPLAGSIPIIVGGDTPAAIDRAARLGDGFYPGEGDLDRLGELITTLRRSAEGHGRDPDAIEVHAMLSRHMDDPRPALERMAQLGVSRVMVPAFYFAGRAGLDRLDEFGEHVIKPTNS